MGEKIPDPYLEGAVRQLLILSELASVTFLPFDPADRQLLDNLQECASRVRDLLGEKKAEAA